MHVGFVGHDSNGGFRPARRGLDLHALVVGAHRSSPLLVDVRASVHHVYSHRAFGGACEGFSCLIPYCPSSASTSTSGLATRPCVPYLMCRSPFRRNRSPWLWDHLG